jgi:hypothetical protein
MLAAPAESAKVVQSVTGVGWVKALLMQKRQ